MKQIIFLNVFKKQLKRTISMLCISYLNTTFPSPLHHSRVFPIPCDLVQSPSPMHLFLETAINNYEGKNLQFHRKQEHSLPFHQPFCKSGAIHAFYLDHCDNTHRSHSNLHDRIESGVPLNCLHTGSASLTPRSFQSISP